MRLRLFLIAVAAVIGAALTWWGATTLFASGVRDDLEGTAGGLDLLPAAAAAGGIACVVWALCALAWQVGIIRTRRRSRRTPEGQPAR